MRNGLPGNRLVHPQQFQSSNGIGMGGYGQGVGQGMVGQGMVDQWQQHGGSPHWAQLAAMQPGVQQGLQQGVQGFQQQGVQGFQGMLQPAINPWGEGGIGGGDGAVGLNGGMGGSIMGGSASGGQVRIC